MLTTTIGVESEYHSGDIDALALELYNRGLAATNHRHDYMCREDGCCAYGEDQPELRVKHDSSCAGEVITNTYSTDDMASLAELFLSLQHAVVDCDVDPGPQAGLHVHVKPPRFLKSRARTVATFARWEEFLMALASGRFTENRDWNNSLRGWSSNWSRYNVPAERTLIECVAAESEAFDVDIAAEFLDAFYANDRHSNLSWSRRFDTFEFRLWNSTRSAWRMSMAAGVSVALTDPDVCRALIRNETDPTVQFLTALNDYGYGDTAALVERQLAYRAKHAMPAMPLLLPPGLD